MWIKTLILCLISFGWYPNAAFSYGHLTSIHVQFHLCNYLPYRPRLSFFRVHRSDTWVSRNCFLVKKETCISGYKDFLLQSYILMSIYTILDVFPKQTFIYFIDFFLLFFLASLNLILLKEKWMILQSLFLFYVNSVFLPLFVSPCLHIMKKKKIFWRVKKLTYLNCVLLLT